MTDTSVAKPRPVPDAQSEGYWQAAAEGVLAISQCVHCGVYAHPPALLCTECRNPEPRFRWQPVSGRGKVRSWTIMRDAFLPAFKADIPWLLVDVELDEQAELRTIGRLVDGPDAPVRLLAPVTVEFDAIAPDVAVPAFRLARGTS